MFRTDVFGNIIGDDELVSSYELVINESEWCPRISHLQLLDLMTVSSIGTRADPSVGYMISNFKLSRFSLVEPYQFLPFEMLKNEELYFDSAQNLFCGYGYLCVIQYNRVFVLNELDFKKSIVSIHWNQFNTGKFFKVEGSGGGEGEKVLLLICSNNGYVYVIDLSKAKSECVQCMDFGDLHINQVAAGVGTYKNFLVVAADGFDRVPILMKSFEALVKMDLVDSDKHVQSKSESKTRTISSDKLNLDKLNKLHIKIDSRGIISNTPMEMSRILGERPVMPQFKTYNIFQSINQQKNPQSIIMPVDPKQSAINIAWSPWLDFPYIALGTEEGCLLVYDFNLVYDMLVKNPSDKVFTLEESIGTIVYKIKIRGEIRLVKFSPLSSVPFLAFYSRNRLYIVDLKTHKTQCFWLATECCGIIWSLDAQKLFVSTLIGLFVFKIKKVPLLTELVLAKLVTNKSIQLNSLNWKQLNEILQTQLNVLTNQTHWI